MDQNQLDSFHFISKWLRHLHCPKDYFNEIQKIPNYFKDNDPEIFESGKIKELLRIQQNTNCPFEMIQLFKKWEFKIAFSNGCFDLLHPGHFYSLESAASFAEILIVGLNSDQSIKKLKGEKRPIQNLETRRKSLLALNFVHLVIPFEEKTPLNLINKVRPDILVKGKDYEEEDIVGAREVKSWGGQVKRIDLVPGLSTSNFLKKLGLE